MNLPNIGGIRLVSFRTISSDLNDWVFLATRYGLIVRHDKLNRHYWVGMQCYPPNGKPICYWLVFKNIGDHGILADCEVNILTDDYSMMKRYGYYKYRYVRPWRFSYICHKELPESALPNEMRLFLRDIKKGNFLGYISILFPTNNSQMHHIGATITDLAEICQNKSFSGSSQIIVLDTDDWEKDADYPSVTVEGLGWFIQNWNQFAVENNYSIAIERTTWDRNRDLLSNICSLFQNILDPP